VLVLTLRCYTVHSFEFFHLSHLLPSEPVLCSLTLSWPVLLWFLIATLA
jgi:hypothetical protein